MSGGAAAGVAVAMASLVAVADALCLSPSSSISSSHCSALAGSSARSLEYPASRSWILSSRAWNAVLAACMLTSQGLACRLAMAATLKDFSKIVKTASAAPYIVPVLVSIYIAIILLDSKDVSSIMIVYCRHI